MPLTLTNVRTWNDAGGKHAIVDATFDSSYPTGGETLDLTAAPFTGVDAFTTVVSVTVTEGPKLSTGAPPARTLCSSIQYDHAASRAVATGVLFAFAEDGTSGVQAQVADTTDLSTVSCRLHIVGT